MRTPKRFNAEVKASSILRLILLELQNGPSEFRKLREQIGVSTATLDKYLKRALKEGLVKHPKRNDPYQITERGTSFLKMTETKLVDDFAIDFVRSDNFGGSIIFRVPKDFVAVFNRLYQPGPLEGLRRVFLVAFEFWVNRYGCDVISESTGQRTGGTAAIGKDFNNDKIWDLTMYETPASGYPNIKKALKKGVYLLNGKRKGLDSVNLWISALNALEERLSKAQY